MRRRGTAGGDGSPTPAAGSPPLPDGGAFRSVAAQTPAGIRSEAACRRAIARDPGCADPHAELAAVLERQGDLAGAERCLRQALSLAGESVALHFALANFLAVSPRAQDHEEARTLFLAVLRAEPEHFGAWNNLGKLLGETGYTSAALTAFRAAVAFHPREALAQVNLANLLLQQGDLEAAERAFDAALRTDAGLAAAHRGLAAICDRRGDGEGARRHRDHAFRRQAWFTLPGRGGAMNRLLVLASALEGNIPWRQLIDPERFETTIVAVEYADERAPLPPHDLLLNAIGDAELCAAGLAIAQRLAARTPAPVVNAPAAVMRTGRGQNAERLARIPGVRTPRVAVVTKAELADGRAAQTLAAQRLAFPLLLRLPGFHGGSHFLRVDGSEALAPALRELPGERLLALEFLDPCAADGLFRKYRVMVIDGRLYPLHLAVAAEWKVHYFTSDMACDARHRAEEASFLDDCRAHLGAAALSALEGIGAALGLDYCGIDFGVDAGGNILLYEANATMVIGRPPDDGQWDYRRPAVDDALAAARRLLGGRVRG